MSKALYIAEKPSVAQEFAKALKINGQRRDGYLESSDSVVTWCVGHLVTMSYPEKYDIKYKRWSLDTLPFLPREFKYEIIPGVQKQFEIVKGLLNREDVDTIYVCTDSGREGEYIYRLVAQMAGVHGKKEKRVWIDSQTEEEIMRGIREAKDLSAYDNLSASAYLRAKEDYLMGINFSRVLTLRYGNSVSNYLNTKHQAISVGRVMTCVLGMVVRREREIRVFVKTPFYRVLSSIALEGENFEGEWRAVEGSRYFQTPYLYKENGFKEKAYAEKLIQELSVNQPLQCVVDKVERKKENKNPPLLFNLAELQNVCSKLFKISPDETLKIVQELYEKKLVTYPRTDARVLSTAAAKEIYKNIFQAVSDTDKKIVPLEEALLINEPGVRRELIMDVLNDDPEEHMDLLKQARMNEDVEVVHYAITAMVELSKEYDFCLQKMEKLYAASPDDPEILEQYCDFMEEYLNQGILEAQMEREQRKRYIRLLRQKLKVKTTLSTCVRLFQNLMKTGDYVQAEEILGLMDQKWHRKEEFWILKIRYLAERKKGAELQQCLRQMKEEQIYLSSKSKEVLAFWLD